MSGSAERLVEPVARSPQRLSLLLLLVPAVIGLLTLLRHEWWRDEAYTWLVVRASGSPSELIANLGFNGHPRPYYLFAWALSRISDHPLALGLPNLALALAAVGLFLRSAPVSRLQGLLFSLGFYPLYQYGVVVRCYSWVLFLLFLYCHLRTARPARSAARLWVLAALAQVHLMSMAAAAVLLLLEVLEARRTPHRWGFRAWAGATAAATSLALAAWQVSPRGAPLASAPLSFRASLRGLANGFFPDYGPLQGTDVHLVVGLAIFAVTVALLLRGRRWALLAYLALAGSLLSICSLVYAGHRWHHGFYFVYLLVALWFAGGERLRGAAARGLTFVLALQAALGAWAIGIDLARDYSDGPLVARYLREHGLEERPLVGMRISRFPIGAPRFAWEFDEIQPALLYRGGTAYDPRADTFDPYYKHYPEGQYFPGLREKQMALALDEVAVRLGTPFVVVVVRSQDAGEVEPPPPLQKLQDFPPVMDFGERYSLYLYP